MHVQRTVPLAVVQPQQSCPAVSVSVLDLDEIDVERERFASTLRIFAMWTVDLAPLDMPELEERVARSGPLHPGGNPGANLWFL